MTHKHDAIKKRCHKEVVELHQFFQEWFNGEIEATDENFSRFSQILAEHFIIISPGGLLTQREPLLIGLRNTQNSRKKCKIRIENFQLHQITADMLVTTYEEWQTDSDGTTNSRISTAIFQEQQDTPNGVVWLHVHETWLSQ